ncbi:hypothetical protein PFISCL1PPCAC_2211 [Pristionchus fissidentatus]|uniref:Uncharacterized protein n=1 Tax=Pristionchus fissidentatus TaxID=1538716 RepID=A0AAV5UYU0_9BILA|nr:hypothetical protein PFISCL1PPCAC_2211 [Pristionchus fissidentatus]
MSETLAKLGLNKLLVGIDVVNKRLSAQFLCLGRHNTVTDLAEYMVGTHCSHEGHEDEDFHFRVGDGGTDSPSHQLSSPFICEIRSYEVRLMRGRQSRDGDKQLVDSCSLRDLCQNETVCKTANSELRKRTKRILYSRSETKYPLCRNQSVTSEIIRQPS